MAPPLGYPKAKKLSASGGLRPLTPDQRLCPWTPLGAPPPDPRAFPSSKFATTPLWGTMVCKFGGDPSIFQVEEAKCAKCLQTDRQADRQTEGRLHSGASTPLTGGSRILLGKSWGGSKK